MAPNLYRIRAESGDGDVDHREAGLFDCSTVRRRTYRTCGIVPGLQPRYLDQVRITLRQSWVRVSNI